MDAVVCPGAGPEEGLEVVCPPLCGVEHGGVCSNLLLLLALQKWQLGAGGLSWLLLVQSLPQLHTHTGIFSPKFLPGESQGLRSLMGGLLWGHTESATTEVT